MIGIFRRPFQIGVLLCALSVACPASATIYTEDFEAVPLGTMSIAHHAIPCCSTETISGGTVVNAIAVGYGPAHSGDQVFAGTKMIFQVADAYDFGWGLVGGWASGPAAIVADAFVWDYDLGMEVLSQSLTVAPGLLSFASIDFSGTAITRVEFSSSAAFVLDDVYYGGTVAIPEAATWAMMIVGVGLIGSTLRLRGRRAPA